MGQPAEASGGQQGCARPCRRDTFGGGVHHCLGHYIARADISVALPILAKHLKNIKLAPGGEWLPDSGNTGPVKMPITFEQR